MMQRAEFRKPVDVIAKECTREWIRFRSKKQTGGNGDDKDAARRISEIETAFKAFNVRDIIGEQIRHGLGYGIGHVWADVGGLGFEATSQATPLRANENGMKKGSLARFKNIEPIWTTPADYNSDTPLRENYYEPSVWWVQGSRVHASRMKQMVPFPVSQMLMPAFNFGGLSLTQQLKTYVHNFLRLRNSVSSIAANFSKLVLLTKMAGRMQGSQSGAFGSIDADEVTGRAAFLQSVSDGQGTIVADKESEDAKILATPLGGLNELLAQAMEAMASIPGIPLVKLFGIQPTGLNACLVGDTLVETNRGAVPIKEVTVKDLVLTRNGFAPLTFAGATKYAVELYEISTAEKSIKCTGNHPIWMPELEKFVPAENVQVGQRLLLIGENPDAPKMHRPSHGGGSGGGAERTATTRHGREKQSGLFCFIARFGRRIVGRCKKASTYITRTATRPIIRFPIWSLCLLAIMLLITTLNSDGKSAFLRTPRAGFAPNARNRSKSKNCRAGRNSVLRHVFCPTGEKVAHQQRSRCLSASVLSAVHRLSLLVVTQSIAVENVALLAKTARNIAERIIWLTRKNGPEPQSKTSEETSVVASIRKIAASEWVYDLSVKEGYLPEFYANGILTHNSSDGEIRVFYDEIAAWQQDQIEPTLRWMFHLIQIHLWGKIDPDLDYEFIHLWQMDEKQAAEVEKLKADTDAVNIVSGKVSPDEAREREATDGMSIYRNVNLSGPAPERPDDLDDGSMTGLLSKAEGDE
nr:anti-CBASS Acb1 family protein [Asaia astilbis]